MKTYVKIYGPPVLEAIRALESIAVGIPEVCIMNTIISTDLPSRIKKDIGLNIASVGNVRITDPVIANWANDYFNSVGIAIKSERCRTIISESGITESGTSLGNFDFYFEWYKKPNMHRLENLIKSIDAAFKELGCMYTLETRR